MAMENGPVEDVFPIENGGFSSARHVSFAGGYLVGWCSTLILTAHFLVAFRKKNGPSRLLISTAQL